MNRDWTPKKSYEISAYICKVLLFKVLNSLFKSVVLYLTIPLVYSMKKCSPRIGIYIICFIRGCQKDHAKRARQEQFTWTFSVRNAAHGIALFVGSNCI